MFLRMHYIEMKKMKLFLRILFLVSLLSYQSHAQDIKKGVFIDTLDNAFDISNYIYNLHGLLPVVAPITEPAIGFGVAGALVYFIPKKSESKGFQMPDMVVGAGGYTANGTWFGGGGYIGFWNEDRVRYRGFAGYGDVTMEYYAAQLSDQSITFNTNSYFFLQQVIARIGASNFFVGGKYQLTQTDVLTPDDGGIWDPRDLSTVNSGLAVIAEFENYNNFLTPSKGILIHMDYEQNSEVIGSDFNFGRLTFYMHKYFPVNQFWVPAIRVETLVATGRPPFYAAPYVRLRGVPMLRYQGDWTMLVETEHAFNLNSRWGMVAFGGVGTSFDFDDKLVRGDNAWNVGGGFRYMMARLLGLKMGIDIARGPEQWAGYVVFGHSWLK